MPTAAILNQERERWARKQTQTLAASTAPLAAAIVKQTQVPVAAATAPLAGALAKKTLIPLAGATASFAGTLAKKTLVVLPASLASFAGTITKRTAVVISAATSAFSASVSGSESGGGQVFNQALNATLAAFSAVLQALHILPFVPVIIPVAIAPAIRRFGVSLSAPAIAQTAGGSIQLFNQPSPTAFSNRDLVQVPGTPDNWGGLGQRAMGGQLLCAPGTGKLGGKIYVVGASGDFTIPAGVTSPTFNLILNENYFTPSGLAVVTNSIPLATLASPAPVPSGQLGTWQLLCWLSGYGVGNGTLIGGYTITVNTDIAPGTPVSGTLTQINNPTLEPLLQLSLGVQFGGNPGAGVFQARLTQFELQNYQY